MPFWYDVPLPALPEFGAGRPRLVKWLVKDRAAVHAGTKLALVETATGRFTVLANGDGYLREKLIQAGAELAPGAQIATIDADGENIPYNRPHSVAEPVKPSLWEALFGAGLIRLRRLLRARR